MIFPLSKRTIRRLWCIRLFGMGKRGLVFHSSKARTPSLLSYRNAFYYRSTSSTIQATRPAHPSISARANEAGLQAQPSIPSRATKHVFMHVVSRNRASSCATEHVVKRNWPQMQNDGGNRAAAKNL
jgi:hypothetical protein